MSDVPEFINFTQTGNTPRSWSYEAPDGKARADLQHPLRGRHYTLAYEPVNGEKKVFPIEVPKSRNPMDARRSVRDSAAIWAAQGLVAGLEEQRGTRLLFDQRLLDSLEFSRRAEDITVVPEAHLEDVEVPDFDPDMAEGMTIPELTTKRRELRETETPGRFDRQDLAAVENELNNRGEQITDRYIGQLEQQHQAWRAEHRGVQAQDRGPHIGF